MCGKFAINGDGAWRELDVPEKTPHMMPAIDPQGRRIEVVSEPQRGPKRSGAARKVAKDNNTRRVPAPAAARPLAAAQLQRQMAKNLNF